MPRHILTATAFMVAALVLAACAGVPAYRDPATGKQMAVIKRYTPMLGPNTLVKGINNNIFTSEYPKQVMISPGRHTVTICHFIPDPFIGFAVFSWVGTVEFEAKPLHTYVVRGDREEIASPGARLMILDTANEEVVAETVVTSETDCP